MVVSEVLDRMVSSRVKVSKVKASRAHMAATALVDSAKLMAGMVAVEVGANSMVVTKLVSHALGTSRVLID
jgi:hypothetical protein